MSSFKLFHYSFETVAICCFIFFFNQNVANSATISCLDATVSTISGTEYIIVSGFKTNCACCQHTNQTSSGKKSIICQKSTNQCPSTTTNAAVPTTTETTIASETDTTIDTNTTEAESDTTEPITTDTTTTGAPTAAPSLVVLASCSNEDFCMRNQLSWTSKLGNMSCYLGTKLELFGSSLGNLQTYKGCTTCVQYKMFTLSHHICANQCPVGTDANAINNLFSGAIHISCCKDYDLCNNGMKRGSDMCLVVVAVLLLVTLTSG